MKRREEIIAAYFRCWVENDPAVLGKTFAEHIVYSECYGPEYRGLGQIGQWFSDWHQKGKVLEWQIKSFLHEKDRTAVEWYFRCEYNGEIDGFDGVSLIEFDEAGKIVSLKEFQSKAEHCFPYGGEGKENEKVQGRHVVEIVPRERTDDDVLSLFSEHDAFMLDFMGEDRHFYTPYNEKELLERIWLIYEDSFPAGCAAYRKKEDGTGEVKRLYVRKEYRGRGLSKNLLKTVEDHAKEDDCQKLYLDTRITLEPACSLYRAFGFEIVFQQGLYIQMEKELEKF